MAKCVGKRGDTLIEVMLAVGIFSMVAVAVVAVMSSGTTSAQTALETTLTREEVDSQAEALRFIHSAYIADKNTGASSKFGALWKTITEKAHNYNAPTEIEEELTSFAPGQCQDLYNKGEEAEKYGFVINTRKLGTLKDGAGYRDVVVSGNQLGTTSTYPHLVFGSDSSLIDDDSATLTSAEGIYIIAVKDPVSTAIAGSGNVRDSAYYDFYIRSCWYGSGDQTPSTISTVMRLYDPDAVKEIEPVPAPTIDPMENENYLINSDSVFALVSFNNGSTVSYRTITGKTLASFFCFTSSAGTSYFGPILVSDDPDAVAYNNFAENFLSVLYESFYYNGKRYYYNKWTDPSQTGGSGWVKTGSCNDAREALNTSYGIKRIIMLDTQMNGEEATKKAAEKLIKQASSK